MKKLVIIFLSAVLLILGCALPLFAQNSFPKTDLSSSQPNQQIKLTPEEQAWLLAHPDIQLGYTDVFEPEVIANPDGSYSGILVDFLAELNRRLGTRIGLRIDPLSELLRKSQAKEVDGILEIHPEYSDKLGLLKSDGYLTGYPAVFARRNISFEGPEDFAGKRVAIIDKVYFSEKMLQQYGKQATILKVKDALEGIRSVSKGEADLFVGVSFNSYYITKYHLFDVVSKYIFEDYPDRFGVAVRPDWPELVSILNKGIASFSQHEIDTIVAKWVQTPQLEKTVKLTSEEQAWIKEHPTIRLGFMEGYDPYLMRDGQGNQSGVLADLGGELSRRLGLTVELKLFKTIPALLKASASKQIDAVYCILPQRAVKRGLLPTNVFLRSYVAVYTRGEDTFNAPDEMTGKTVAILADAGIAKIFVQPYLEKATIVVTDTPADGLRMLQNGEVDLFVGTTTHNYFANKYRFFGIRTAYVHTDQENPFAMGVRSDWPELVAILDKGLASFGPRGIEKIVAQWTQSAESAEGIDLSVEEQAWIHDHPNFKVGLFSVAPYQYMDGDRITGYNVELMEAICRLNGLVPEFSMHPLAELLEKLESGSLDVAPILTHNKDRARYLEFSQKFTYQVGIFAQAGNADIIDKESLNGKTIASYKGYALEGILKPFVPDARFIHADDAVGMLRLVAAGKADAAIQEIHTGEFMLRKNVISNVVRKGVVELEEPTAWLAYEYSTRKDLPLLKSILDKSRTALLESEKNRIWNKWFSNSTEIKSKTTITLTPEEQAWLAQDQTVQVRVVNIPPYIFHNKGAAPSGMSIDYLKLISERSGVKFEYVSSGKSFPEALAGLKSHQGPDLVPLITQTPERAQSILFSKDYLHSPFVIFNHVDDKEFISEITDLVGKKIALPRGQLVHERIKSEYPELNLVLFDNDAQAIDAVATGQAEAYIGNLTLASYLIPDRGLIDLKIAGTSPFGDQVFSMGIRNDWPELASIINKGLASISPEERANIRNEYISIKYEHTETAVIVKWFLIIGGTASGIVLLFVFWNRSLKQKVAERTTEVVEREAQFRATFEQAAVGIAHVAPDGTFLRINQKFCDIVGYSRDEMLERTFQEITHPDDLNSDIASIQLLLDGETNSYSLEKRYIRKDSGIVWANLTVALVSNDDGDARWFVSVIEDISKRKRAEESLRDSEEKFRYLVEQSPLSIQVLSPEGRIVQVNEAFMKLWGITEKNLPEVLEKYHILEDEELKAAGIMPLIEMAFKGDQVSLPIFEYDAPGTMETLEVDSPDTVKRWIQARLYPIKDSKGEIVNIVDVEEDVTERIISEQRVQEHQQRLKALASQLTLAEEHERRRIAADLHDDVGQTLAMTRLQLAAAIRNSKDNGLNEQLDEISQTVLKATQDTRLLIFELSSPTISELGIGAAVEEWVEINRKKVPGIVFEVINNLHEAEIDQDVRAILFRNVRELLTNTIKYSRADQVTVALETTGNEIRVTIKDNGVGFNPSQVLNHVNSEGGFGLFSVQARMVDLGGTLEIDSAPHRGCAMIMSIPRELK